MTETKSISVSEIKEVYEFLEEINHLFHQPLNYQDSETIEIFAKDHYPQIHKLYYEVVWEWLPDEEKKKYEDR